MPFDRSMSVLASTVCTGMHTSTPPIASIMSARPLKSTTMKLEMSRPVRELMALTVQLAADDRSPPTAYAVLKIELNITPYWAGIVP